MSYARVLSPVKVSLDPVEAGAPGEVGRGALGVGANGLVEQRKARSCLLRRLARGAAARGGIGFGVGKGCKSHAQETAAQLLAHLGQYVHHHKVGRVRGVRLRSPNTRRTQTPRVDEKQEHHRWDAEPGC